MEILNSSRIAVDKVRFFFFFVFFVFAFYFCDLLGFLSAFSLGRLAILFLRYATFSTRDISRPRMVKSLSPFIPLSSFNSIPDKKWNSVHSRTCIMTDMLKKCLLERAELNGTVPQCLIRSSWKSSSCSRMYSGQGHSCLSSLKLSSVLICRSKHSQHCN